jgi:Tfp pilus assembly protein PilF
MTEQWLADYASCLEKGIALADQGQHSQAIVQYDAAIALSPLLSPAYINRGIALSALKQHDAALMDLNRAIELQPTLAMAYNNRGAIYRALGQSHMAVQDYLKAIELAGDAAVDAHGNLATYFFETKQYELAAAYYEKAIELQPDYALTHWNYGMCLLQMGDLARGWREYHWRWQEPKYRAEHRRMDAPLWLGAESLAGKTILLQAEQGFGDMIQFCRYAPLLAAQGARVWVEAQAGLVTLFCSLQGVTQVFSKTDALPSFDFYCPMMSLPLAFGTTLESIPAPARYLYADPMRVKKWADKLGARTKPRVGVVWSSDEGHPSSVSRSVPLDVFVNQMPDDYEFVSLQRATWQRDIPALERSKMRHFESELTDFAETAALCELMDVVISVDTSVAHLAGALGKPVRILLHTNNDWRWLLDRSDSVWYPSATLFRQAEISNWADVVARVMADLKQHLA